MAATVVAFMQPVQIATTLGAATNFGGSVLQGPLIMPMVQDEYIKLPIKQTSKQLSYLLHNSEFFFPPLNALCSLANLTMTGLSYYYSRDSPILAAKFPYLAAATGLNIATTIIALTIQVPKNKKMTKMADEFSEDSKDESEQRKKVEFRAIQKDWVFMNYVRASTMIASAVAGALALTVTAI